MNIHIHDLIVLTVVNPSNTIDIPDFYMICVIWTGRSSERWFWVFWVKPWLRFHILQPIFYAIIWNRTLHIFINVVTPNSFSRVFQVQMGLCSGDTYMIYPSRAISSQCIWVAGYRNTDSLYYFFILGRKTSMSALFHYFPVG